MWRWIRLYCRERVIDHCWECWVMGDGDARDAALITWQRISHQYHQFCPSVGQLSWWLCTLWVLVSITALSSWVAVCCLPCFVCQRLDCQLQLSIVELLCQLSSHNLSAKELMWKCTCMVLKLKSRTCEINITVFWHLCRCVMSNSCSDKTYDAWRLCDKSHQSTVSVSI